MLIINKSTVGPKLAGNLFARKKLAGPVEEHQKHLEGLGVQLDAQALAAKLSRGGVYLKDSEAIARGGLRAGAVFRHGFQTSVADGDLDRGHSQAMEDFFQVAPMEALAR